jgi:glycosyltransferase involved in cell wall biosynthesis
MSSLCFVVESGTDVRLVEGLSERFDLSVLARRIPNGVEISQPPARTIPTIVGSASRLRFGFLVLRHLRNNHCHLDSVIVQGYGVAALAANLAGRVFRVPTLMLVCSPVERYYSCRKKFSRGNKRYRRFEALSLQVLARINALIGQQYVVLSDHLAKIVRHHGANTSIEIIPVYGVDTALFQPSTEPKLELKKRLGLPTTGSVIFFSSRIAPEKDSETLLDAFRLLLDKELDIWLLHRSGGYQRFLEAAKEYGVAHRVIATDAVHPHSQLPIDYQASDLCVQASREEGLGFSPLEALACEVPVVAADVGGLKETILDGVTGWTYQVGNAEQLADAIGFALNQPAEAARRAKAGRKMVMSKYEQKSVFAEFARVVARNHNRQFNLASELS